MNNQQALRRLQSATNRALHKEATKKNSKSERIATDDQSSTTHQQHHRMIQNKEDI
jgi:hypothetical protein